MIETLRKTILVTREALKLTHAEVAAKSDVTEEQLAAFEMGSGTLDLDALDRVSIALGLTMALVPECRRDDILIILEQEGLSITDATPSPMRMFGHLLLD